MTTEKLQLAKELDHKIGKLSAFLKYYKDDNYRMSIHFDNKNDSIYHSEVFHFKQEDDELTELIESYLSIKLSKLQKQFDEL